MIIAKSAIYYVRATNPARHCANNSVRELRCSISFHSLTGCAPDYEWITASHTSSSQQRQSQSLSRKIQGVTVMTKRAVRHCDRSCRALAMRARAQH